MRKFGTIIFLIFLASRLHSQVNVSTPSYYAGMQFTEVDVPVLIDNLSGKKIYSYDLKVTFDTTCLTILGTNVTNTISTGMMVLANTTVPGEIRVSAASATPLTGNGVLIYLKFMVIGDPNANAESNLTISSFQLNSSSNGVSTTNGNFWVVQGPSLWVIPQSGTGTNSVVVPNTAGSTKLFVSNLGTGTMNWTASSSDTWLSITSGLSGTNSGTISLAYSDNLQPTKRIGYIWVISQSSYPVTIRTIEIDQLGSRPSAPILELPLDNDDTISVNTLFSWDPAAGATSYNLQVSTSMIDWTNPVVNISGISNVSYTLLTKLNNNTRYYWRVSSTNSGGTSDWSILRSFVTVPPTPAIPTIISPVNNGYGYSIFPTFSWVGVQYATSYEVQASTSENSWSPLYFDSIIVNKTSFTIDSLHPLSNSKRYYWRIRSMMAGGSSDWLVQNFKTVLATPTLNLPLDQNTSLPLSPSFSWSTVPEATSYNLQISDSLNWNSPKYQYKNLSKPNYTISDTLNGFTTYYWRASAQNMEGTSVWSQYRSFSTIQTIPKAPTLLSPINNATCIPAVPMILFWKTDNNADYYNIQISTDSIRWDQSTMVFNQTNNSGTIDVGQTLKGNLKYYWRVSSANYALGTGPWSSINSFTTTVSTPQLISPQNSETGVSITPTLIWLNGDTTTSYSIQVTLDSSKWTNLIVDQSNISNTAFFTITKSLSFNTVYFWRVKGSNKACISSWSQVYSFRTTLASPTPDAPVLALPLDNDDTISTYTKFSWFASLGASTYSLQASLSLIDWSNPAVNVAGISDISYTLKTPLTNSTRYYWRVRASNYSGTSEWSIVRSFITVPPKPDIPTPTSPSNGGYGVSVYPTFTWVGSMDANSYEVQASIYETNWTTPYFDSIIVNKTFFTIDSLHPLLNSKKYYWRIRSANTGGSSDWSPVQNFKTILATPAMYLPIDLSTDLSVIPSFSWSTVDEATSYNLQISDTLNWNSPVYSYSNLSKPNYSQSDSLYGFTTYYWRVSAQNMEGTSVWSNYRSFKTIKTIPRTTTLISPINNAKCVPFTPAVFSWKKDNSADYYHFQISKDVKIWDSTALVIDSNRIISTNDTVKNLKGNVTYFWRVNAVDTVGASQWSPINTFTTALSAPQLSLPKNSDIGVSVMPILSWLIADNATSYYLQVSLDSINWTNLIIDQSNILTTAFTLPKSLSSYTIYFWRVKASNGTCISEWSKIYQFKTALGTPLLSSPTDNTLLSPTSLTLKWKSVVGAISYNLQVSSDPNFISPIQVSQNVADSSYLLSNLQNSTIYYWRVNATDGKVTSSWSDYWRFTTVEAKPDKPTLSQPANNDIGITLNPTLKWNAISGSAIKYNLQVATDVNFTSIISTQSNLTSASYNLSSLSNSTIYYWKVNATNNGGISDWSDTWSFKTVGPASIMIKVVGDSQINVVNRVLLNPLSVRITDAANYPVSNTNVTFSFTRLPDSASGQNISTPSVKTNEKGEASTLISLGSKAGIYQVSASSQGLSGSPVVFSATATAGSPARMTITSGNGQSAEVNKPLSNPLIIKVSDTYNNPVGNISVRFSIQNFPSGATGQKLSVVDTFTDAQGLASSSFIFGDTPGLYQILVNSNGLTGNATFSENAILPAYSSTIKLSSTGLTFPVYSKTSDYQVSDWRIIGVPGASNAMISYFIDGVQNNDWQVYWDNGSSQNYLIKYDGSSVFIDSVGKGFWLIKKGDWNLQATVPSASLNANQEVEIHLHTGWNLITNPFLTQLSWLKIQTINGIKIPLFSFKGHWDTSNTFSPYTGYMFDNSAKIQVLRIPYYLLFLNSGSSLLKGSSEWEVNVKLISQNNDWGTVSFGVSKEEELKFRKPRDFADLPSISLKNSEISDIDNYSFDIRTDNKDLKEWDLAAVSKDNGENSLVFTGIQNIPLNLAVFLVNEDASKKINLREDSVFNFISSNSSTKFKILLGDKDAVDQKINSLFLPKEFILKNCYPNPFNPSTNIRVCIPSVNRICLKVYDILGREVRTLFNGELNTGEYSFEWNGKDNSGNVLPSGTYIYRLITEQGITLSNKMILMK